MLWKWFSEPAPGRFCGLPLATPLWFLHWVIVLSHTDCHHFMEEADFSPDKSHEPHMCVLITGRTVPLLTWGSCHFKTTQSLLRRCSSTAFSPESSVFVAAVERLEGSFDLVPDVKASNRRQAGVYPWQAGEKKGCSKIEEDWEKRREHLDKSLSL